MWQTVTSYNDLACQVYEHGIASMAFIDGSEP